MTPGRAARRLTALLAEERAAAAAGDLDRLAGMAPEKERLAAAVEAGLAAGHFDPEPGAGPNETLRRLARALGEAEPLLRAALEGVRGAQQRLDARREARRAPFRTYGRDGTAGAIGAAPAGPVRRA